MAPAPAPTDRLPWHHSLRTRIALWLGLFAILLAMAGGLAIHAEAKRRLLDDAEASALRDLRRTAAELRALLQAVEVSAATLARAQPAVADDAVRALALLDATVLSEPNVAGGLVVLAPEHAPTPGVLWARYAGKEGRTLMHRDLVARGIDVAVQPWYRETLASPAPRWSAPYLNETAGERWMVTLNQPMRGDDGDTTGMVSLDVPIDRFNQALGVFRSDGPLRAVLHKDALTLGDSRWAATAEPPPTAPGFDALRHSLREASARAPNRMHRLKDGTRGQYEAIGDGWGLVVFFEESAVLAPLHGATWRFVGATLVVIALFAVLGNALARDVTRPLVLLGDSAQTLAAEGFAIPAHLLARRDEVGQLARALDGADALLRDQVARTQQLAQEQQRLDSELRLAHDLQQSMLPVATAIDVHEGHLDVHATLKPAKSVGGDFYAFRPRDDGMLWFAVGDISDKGVPAALFMARTVAVLEATARNTNAPALMLARAAPRLAEGNDSCMFATVLCGIIDPHTGMFELASAGHDPPFIVRADGRVEPFEMATGAPLGIDPDAYGEGFAGMLGPGDTLLCFTDGVTEARDRHGGLFGEARLCEVLSRPGRRAQQRVADVLAAVEAFSSQAEPADDITILGVGLAAPEGTMQASVRFSIWPSGLQAMNAAIDAHLESEGIAPPAQADVRLVLEEIISNALDHAGAGECTVDLGLSPEAITLTLIDDGMAFNPLTHPTPPLPPDDQERPLGGLGLQLVRALVADARYARESERNHLTLVLPRNPSP